MSRSSTKFRLFQYAVRQRALAVVNVGNDAEIPDPFAWYCQMNHRLLSQKVPYSPNPVERSYKIGHNNVLYHRMDSSSRLINRCCRKAGVSILLGQIETDYL